MGQVRRCQCGCNRLLPDDAHGNVKYLNVQHRNRAANGIRARSEPSVGIKGRSFEEFCRDGWPELIEDGMTYDEVSALTGMNKGTISRLMATFHDQRRAAAAPAPELDVDLFSDLVRFTEEFFPEDLIPEFHKEWIAAIDDTVSTGRKLLLLAPQRFGKSSCLIRYCLMRIARDPNIRILWVSKTQGLAEKMVGFIRQHLEHNEKLRHAVIGEHRSFVPGRTSGLPWTNSQFTIATRTEIRKTPTMVAIGTGGQILGLDADLVILDDPQDRKRCMSPANRESDAEWFFTDFLSRKEEETGVAFIMSRQHVEDLPGQVMRDHPDEWEVRTYRSHDPACVRPEADLDAHHDCLLWPEKRTWPWLYGQKKENPAHFERNYQNNPTTDATTYITADEIDRIRDRTRRVGELPHGGGRLIVGIDPAEAKPVAAVLWCFDGIQRHLIDCWEASASVVGLRQILSTWPPKYGVRDFVFEKNIAQSWIIDDEVRKLRELHRLHIREHYTGRHNKNSHAIGPIAMFQRMRSEPPEITLPGAPGEGQDRIDRFIRSCLSFDPDWASSKHADDDLVMAAWMPQITIDGWDRPKSMNVQLDYDAIGSL